MSEVLHRLATKESIDALTEAIENLPSETQDAADAANAAAENALGNFAKAFDATKPYKKNEIVTYTDGKTYRFKEDRAAGAWSAGDVDEINVGHEIGLLQSTAEDLGVCNIINSCPRLASHSYGGVTLTVNGDGSYTFSGTATETAVFNLLNYNVSGLDFIPDDFVQDDIYCIGFSPASQALAMDFFRYSSGGSYIAGITTNGELKQFKFIDRTEKLVFRFRVDSGTSVNVTVRPVLYNTKTLTNRELTAGMNELKALGERYKTVEADHMIDSGYNQLESYHSYPYSFTYAGITYTLNSDGTWDVEGTATEDSVCNFVYQELPQWIHEGEYIRMVNDTNAVSLVLRFFDGNGTQISGATVIKNYDVKVPAGTKSIVLRLQVSSGAEVDVSGGRFGIYIQTEINQKLTILTKDGYTITGKTDTLETGTDFEIVRYLDNRKNATLDFWCNFSSFDSVTVAHGEYSYGGYITIDGTYAKVYHGSELKKTYEHGLTLSGFIGVHVEQGDDATAAFVITTAGGSWESDENAYWRGCSGIIFARATMTVTNVRYSATFKDFRKDLFVFADSYGTLGTGYESRWPYFMKNVYHTDNYALFGWGGETSSLIMPTFRNAMKQAKPIWAAWFMGMNDGDTNNAINASWKECVEEFIKTCEVNGITPVLATIPNTPTVNNTYKNTYVRNSGYAYVDFAKAVGAESAGSSWYAGMLDSDNLHPTALGGAALSARLVADLPQIIG